MVTGLTNSVRLPWMQRGASWTEACQEFGSQSVPAYQGRGDTRHTW